MSHEKADFYKPLAPLIRKGLDLKFDRTVQGLKNIPDTPALYTPNHLRFEDSPLLAVSYSEQTKIPMRFGAKREYFDGEGLDGQGKFGRTLQWIMEHGQMVPVDREGTNPRASQNLQLQIADRLANGDAVALHPEGTRSEDGKLHKFKSGAARIAIALSVPIVPVGITYHQYDNRKRMHVNIEFGKPILPEEFITGPHSLLPARQKADYFMQLAENRVADMTGMPQSGAFAQLRKFRNLGGDRRK